MRPLRTHPPARVVASLVLVIALLAVLPTVVSAQDGIIDGDVQTIERVDRRP